MTASTVDLSLPTDQEMLAAGSPNPEAEAIRLTATGNPGRIREIATALMAGGVDLDAVYDQSRRAQRVLAGGFTNDGAPVYDEEVHRRALPAGFRDAGTQLYDTGRRLGAVSDELDTAMSDVTRSLDRLRADLAARRSGFAVEVDAARAAGD